MKKNYSGSDLSQEFKSFFHREKKRLTSIFTEKGCTNIEMKYGFNFFMGFFTSPSGQVYYFSSPDTRFEGYKRLLIRTAKSYSDCCGGGNEFCGTSKEDLIKFRLK